jgi:protocatechuate 3,4-dioxygenase beta subunit
MERKEFIKKLGFGTMLVPFLVACSDSDDPTPSNNSSGGSSSGGTDTGSGTGSGTCTVSPTETAGPFPTKDPASLERVDIRSDRTGVVMDVEITIQDKSNGCTALAGVMVDIWHCDAAGNYSEYGGTTMQSTNYQSVHFLRGRQETNSDGVASFRTIFPGWYSGRAPHIHVHIYDSSGNSLLVTQIAFPTDVCDTVYTTATTLYTKGKQDTSNTSDNVFSDSLAAELATVTGSIAEGFLLTKTIVVS